MNAEVVLAIERGLKAPHPVDAPQQVVASVSETDQLDVDRLDRLTGIIDRTRLALGQAAARQLWPMLGLPDLRTSTRPHDKLGASPASELNGRLPLFDHIGISEVILSETRRTAQFGRRHAGVRGAGELRTSAGSRSEREMPPTVKVWVARFLDECCETDPKAEMRAVVFREAFKKWVTSRGGPIPQPASLGRYVINLGVQKRKRGSSIYVGLRLKPHQRLIERSRSENVSP